MAADETARTRRRSRADVFDRRCGAGKFLPPLSYGRIVSLDGGACDVLGQRSHGVVLSTARASSSAEIVVVVAVEQAVVRGTLKLSKQKVGGGDNRFLMAARSRGGLRRGAPP